MFVFVWNCLIFFVGKYLSVWPEICRVLSQIQWRFLGGISGIKYSGRIFQKFCATKAILYRNLWNSGLISAISFWVRIALKKFTQALSYVVCTQARRHVHKRITKRRYGEEKPGRFIFGKLVLFTLGVGHTTPYSSGILVWNFYQTFVTVSIEFWMRFDPQIRPTRLAINFYSSLPGLKGRFVCEWNCLIFFVGEYSSVWPKICRVLSQIQWRFLGGISGKYYSRRIFQKFCATKVILNRNLWNSGLISAIWFWVRIALKKIHSDTFVCSLHPGKEARP